MTKRAKRGGAEPKVEIVKPADDGFERSLRQARTVCGAMLALPVLFAVATAVHISRGGVPHEEPAIVAALTIVGLTMMCAPALVRAEMVRSVIVGHLGAEKGLRRPRAVYGAFAGASVAAYVIAQTGALFGFIASVLTVTWWPLLIGCAMSYASWLTLWPRRGLWMKWTRGAKLREGSGPAGPAKAPGTDITE